MASLPSWSLHSYILIWGLHTVSFRFRPLMVLAGVIFLLMVPMLWGVVSLTVYPVQLELKGAPGSMAQGGRCIGEGDDCPPLFQKE